MKGRRESRVKVRRESRTERQEGKRGGELRRWV